MTQFKETKCRQVFRDATGFTRQRVRCVVEITYREHRKRDRGAVATAGSELRERADHNGAFARETEELDRISGQV